jgi:fumigallin biosynthesis monooxygenase-like protein
MAHLQRSTVDLSDYPDLVVIYLGMRVEKLRGVATLMKFGPKISASAEAKPDGLLLHENIFYSFFPLHAGMRQYWRDFQSLENWTRSLPHQEWWKDFLKDPGGTGFWHEAYFMRGGMEAIYDNVGEAFGFAKFAPIMHAKGPMFGARKRLGLPGEAAASPVREEET